MKTELDLESLLAPLPGDNPAGEELRYSKVYDDIREARRADDLLPQGEWQREIKSSDWKKVISLCIQALSHRSKDLQIAAWLTEALATTEGFEGFKTGVTLLTALLDRFWETLYPQIEDGDYDYRIAPLEFFNDRLALCLRQVPLTEPGGTPGYSLLKWQESRETARRDEAMITADDFTAAVMKSSTGFYQALAGVLERCREAFTALDEVISSRLADQAPRMADVREALEECHRVVMRICRDQKGLRIAEAGSSAVDAAPNGEAAVSGPDRAPERSPQPVVAPGAPVIPTSAAAGDETAREESLWRDALRTMEEGNFEEALAWLLAAANSQPSKRGHYRYQFLVARLCLKGGRPDLARPIMEQIHAVITELQLERWESPFWIAEVLESLHHCLLTGEPSSDDTTRAEELFRKICTMDVTKVLNTRQ